MKKISKEQRKMNFLRRREIKRSILAISKLIDDSFYKRLSSNLKELVIK